MPVALSQQLSSLFVFVDMGQKALNLETETGGRGQKL